MKRCGLRTPKSVTSCQHRTEISGGKDLNIFIQQCSDAQKGNTNLGFTFLIISLIILGFGSSFSITYAGMFTLRAGLALHDQTL